MPKPFAVLAALLAVPATAATTFTDGSFEAQGAAGPAGAQTNYCYFDRSEGGGPCAIGAWSGLDAGIQFEGNTPWPGRATATGIFYGFVRQSGTLQQRFTGDGGSYTLSWFDAGRPPGVAGGNQTYDVNLLTLSPVSGNPVLLTTTLGSFETFASQDFTARSLSNITLVDGLLYALEFRGTNLRGGDQTAFIDAVSLGEGNVAAVPEPAAWAMLILGFGLVGAATRRRTRRPASL